MLFVILKALYFFLPAYAANAAPVIFAKFNLWKRLNVPIDSGKKFKGQYLFGNTKTWRGILAGVLTASTVALLQYFIFTNSDASIQNIYIFNGSLAQFMVLGFLMGIGEGLGDIVKSFFKRRLGKKSGDAFFPFDQMSFLGALLLSFIVYIPANEYILAIIVFSPAIPVIANLIAYKTGLKKVWW